MQDFIDFIAGVMEVDPSELNEETGFGEHPKWDSLMHMRMVMEVEDEYDTEIPIEEIPTIRKLKDFYKYLDN